MALARGVHNLMPYGEADSLVHRRHQTRHILLGDDEFLFLYFHPFAYKALESTIFCEIIMFGLPSAILLTNACGLNTTFSELMNLIRLMHVNKLCSLFTTRSGAWLPLVRHPLFCRNWMHGLEASYAA